MVSEDDARAAAAIAAWCADRGDRVPVSADDPVAVTGPEAAAAVTEAGAPAGSDPWLAEARDVALAEHPAFTPGGPHAAAALLPSDVTAGGTLEALVAGASTRVRDGGVVLIAAPGRFVPPVASAGEASGVEALTLARAVGQAGLTVIDQLAPGAASRLTGGPDRLDLAADRTPGLLDAGRLTMCVARRWRDAGDRERAFFASLPRKIAAAAVLCRDARGRLLCVHDAFKQRWTIPGGVVDADETPDEAARRETREEAGVDIDVGALLGVFSAAWPDRLTFVYAGTARDEPAGPAHAHEIDAVEWLELDAALERLVGYVAEQVRWCLDQPGGTWRQSTV